MRTYWVGVTPQDVEQEILVRQERFLARIPGLVRMASWANTGEARVELEFAHGADINEILIRVNNALSRVSGYPENVVEPSLSATSFSNVFICRPYKICLSTPPTSSWSPSTRIS